MSRPLPETELVDRARRGDEDAYEELVRAHQGIAFRTAYLLSGNASDAEEAAQDGFVKAYRALGRFRPGAPFRPWLLKIVANEARNRRRAAGRRATLALRAAGSDPSGGAAPSPEGPLLAEAERETLLAAVNALREEERLVIACRYFLELSEEETAASLGIRRGTVKSRTSRALERLREMLEVEMPELERALVDLGRAVELPPAPEIAASVRARLAETPRRRFGVRGLAIALAVLAVAIAAVLAVPPARTAIFEWLGIKGVAITRVEELPPTPVAGDLALGEQVTIAEARRRAPWLVLPGDVPDAVYFNRDVTGGQVSLLWGSPKSVRLLMTELRGRLIATKLLGPGTNAEQTDVSGAPAVWLSGAPHFFVYQDSDGEVRERTLRVVRNALLWQRGELTLRLEGGLSKGEALRIARSAR